MCDPFGYESEDIACKFMRQKLFKVTWKLLTLMCAGSIKISFEDEGYNFLFEVIAAKIRIGGFRGNCNWFLTLTLHTIESAWPAWAEGGVKIVIEAKTFWAVESLLKQLSLSTLPSCLPTHMSSDVVLGSRAFKRKLTASSVSPFLDNEKEHWDFLLPNDRHYAITFSKLGSNDDGCDSFGIVVCGWSYVQSFYI